MSQELPSAHDAPALNFRTLLPAGAMLASLAVVAYACLSTSDSMLQARTIRQGTELIMLVWVAGLLASLVRFGRGERSARALDIEAPPRGRRFGT
jgi:hypothetical protein